MNSYKFSLKQYKAVYKAEIEFNGLTVLAGENGAGKSTITRWLYFLVEAISNYERYAFNDMRREIYSLLREYRMALRDTRMVGDNNFDVSVSRWSHLAKSIDFTQDEEVGIVIHEAKEIIIRIADYLQNNIDEKGRISNRLARTLIYLELDDKSFNKEEFVEQNFHKIDAFYSDYVLKLKSRSRETLFEYITHYYEINLKFQEGSVIQLTEDKVPILEKSSVGHLLGLRRAIYIDTPMALGMDMVDHPLWGKLSELLEERGEVILPASVRKMLMRLQYVIHGSVIIEDNDFDSDMHYLREDNLDIPLVEAATGIKSFAYIIRLLENGYLDKNTLLIIDEPEAHLHPQWIVEYARILVLLVKEIGVRVLVASHNPDMVAAIQSIGMKEGLADAITFYQAYSSAEHPFEYEYKNLGHEITEIFQSFNIALSRIQDYGTVDNK